MSSITIRRGDTWKRTSKFTLASGTLAGCKLWMTIKAKLTDPDPGLVQIVSDGDSPGILIDDADDATFTLSAAKTDLLPAGRNPLHFDVQIKLPSGEIYTTDSGPVTVEADVTRSTT